MTRWRIMRNASSVNGGPCRTDIISENLPQDMAQDLVKVLNALKNGAHYFSIEYEEARQHSDASKPHIEWDILAQQWCCVDGTGVNCGFGLSPEAAYADWIANKEELL